MNFISKYLKWFQKENQFMQDYLNWNGLQNKRLMNIIKIKKPHHRRGFNFKLCPNYSFIDKLLSTFGFLFFIKKKPAITITTKTIIKYIHQLDG